MIAQWENKLIEITKVQHHTMYKIVCVDPALTGCNINAVDVGIRTLEDATIDAIYYVTYSSVHDCTRTLY